MGLFFIDNFISLVQKSFFTKFKKLASERNFEQKIKFFLKISD